MELLIFRVREYELPIRRTEFVWWTSMRTRQVPSVTEWCKDTDIHKILLSAVPPLLRQRWIQRALQLHISDGAVALCLMGTSLGIVLSPRGWRLGCAWDPSQPDRSYGSWVDGYRTRYLKWINLDNSPMSGKAEWKNRQDTRSLS